MKKLISYILPLFIIPLIILSAVVSPVYAAEFRTGDQIAIEASEQPLVNPYIFGGSVRLDAPVSNELTTAGGDIFINSAIEGSALIAGGNISLRGSVGNNARIAGGNITIDSPITNDLVVTGGSIKVTEGATIGGDILFAGGSLIIDAPVEGNVRMAGGNVIINNRVGGDVTGEIEELSLGPNAVVAGNLSYKSPQRARVAQGAQVQGRTDYKQSEDRRGDEKDARAFLTGAALYKLITDIIITTLFIYFFRRALSTVINRMKDTPLRSGAIGFGFFILVPLLALILLILFWLGIATFLFYALMYFVALYVMKAFIGWAIMKFWYSNKKQDYLLDWKAGILGPIAVFLLLLIPILGWLAIAIIFLIGLGALVEELVQLASNQRGHIPATAKSTTARKK